MSRSSGPSGQGHPLRSKYRASRSLPPAGPLCGAGLVERFGVVGVVAGWPRIYEACDRYNGSVAAHTAICISCIRRLVSVHDVLCKHPLRFGFSVASWQRFADALKLQGSAHEVATTIETSHGPRYYVDGIIETPDGRNPFVRTVWQVDSGSDYPRLITAYPRRR